MWTVDPKQSTAQLYYSGSDKREREKEKSYMFTITHMQAHIPGTWHWYPIQTWCPIIVLEGKQSLQDHQPHGSSTTKPAYEEMSYRKVRLHRQQPLPPLTNGGIMWWLVILRDHASTQTALLGWYCFVRWGNSPPKVLDLILGWQGSTCK